MNEQEYWYKRFLMDVTNADALHEVAMSALKKQYGFYQLCPKCDGEKHIEGGSYNPDGSLTINRTCPLCEGEGKLVRPEIKPGE